MAQKCIDEHNKYIRNRSKTKRYEHHAWKKHIDSISKKVSHATAILLHVSNILPQHILKHIYTSIAKPIFNTAPSYGGAVVRLRLIGFNNYRTEQFG